MPKKVLDKSISGKILQAILLSMLDFWLIIITRPLLNSFKIPDSFI